MWVCCQVNTGRDVNAFQMFAEDYGADGLNAPCNYSCHGVVLPCPARSICIQTSQTDLFKCPGRLETAKEGEQTGRSAAVSQSALMWHQKHRSHRWCSRSPSAARGGPWSRWSCWVSSPQVVPRKSENPELFHATGFTSRVWFQASPIPPAGAAAASPRCWSISRWCPSRRREAATRWSTCLSWSTRPSLWWVPRTIPTVPSGLLKFLANVYFLLLHLSIHVVYCFYFFTGHQESPHHQSHAGFTRKLSNMCEFIVLFFFNLLMSSL